MTKNYIDANEKYVACVTIYSNGSKFYYDEAMKEEVPTADCLNLFLKGVVCKKGTTYYNAVSCTANGVLNFGTMA